VALYSRFQTGSGSDFRYFALSGPELADIRSRVNGFAGVAALSFNSRNLTRGNGEAERVLTMAVTPEFFDVLGVKPVRGRTSRTMRLSPATRVWPLSSLTRPARPHTPSARRSDSMLPPAK
jgi:hypothetical protein